MLQASLFKTEVRPSTGGGIKIPVGLHNGGVFFSGVTNEAGWMDINFTNKEGRVIHKRLFTPAGANPKTGENIQEAYNREVERNLVSLVHVMEALLGDDVVETFGAADYKTFVTGAATLLNNLKGTEVNLKVIPDWKEQIYPDLPMRSFVEKHIPGAASALWISKKEQEQIDNMGLKRNPAKEESVESHY